MSDIHGKIIAAGAKSELAALGFKRKGQSRLWLADRASWLNVVEFTPSRWAKSVSLINAAHWLWLGTGFLSFNESVDSKCYVEFETDEQFRNAVAQIAKTARDKALEMEAKFPCFQKIAEFVVQRALSSPDRMALSWWGYEAGVASAIIGKTEDAGRFLTGLTDERVTVRAAPLLSLIDRPDAFRAKVNEMVGLERVSMNLPPLDLPAF